MIDVSSIFAGRLTSFSVERFLLFFASHYSDGGDLFGEAETQLRKRLTTFLVDGIELEKDAKR